MIIQTKVDPEAVWNAAEDRFDYVFREPITVNLKLVAWAKSGFGGSIISTGGPAFTIEMPYEILSDMLVRLK